MGFAPFLGEVLRAHRARQVEERLASSEERGEPELVFTTAPGRPARRPHLTHRFQLLLHHAGVRRCRFHDLRQPCATVLLAQDVSAGVVMEMLGHSQISVSMNTYTHVLPALQQEAVERMGASMQPARVGRSRLREQVKLLSELPSTLVELSAWLSDRQPKVSATARRTGRS